MNTSRPFRKFALATLSGLVLSGCTSTKGTEVSVDYYQIQGNSTAALDRDIRRKGPMLGKTGHAVAVARIQMLPTIKYRPAAGLCRVIKSKVDVKARVTLPEWKGRKNANAKLGKIWDNVDRYARLHEAVHVAIAFKYARRMEAAILAQKPKANCLQMRRETAKIFETLLQKHDQEQKAFDADEQKRLASYSKKKSS